jgi:hypothetical protein
MSFNVAVLPVAMGGMVQSLNVPRTTVGTGIVLYSPAVAGSRQHLFRLVLAAGRVLARPHVLTRIPTMNRLRTRSAVSPSMFCRRFFRRAARGQ